MEGHKREDAHELLEALAALEHDQWAHWTKHMLGVLAPLNNREAPQTDEEAHALSSVGEAQRRWRKQIETPYADLTETEKDSDREWAAKVLETVFGNRTECPKCRRLNVRGGGFPCESGCDDEVAQIDWGEE